MGVADFSLGRLTPQKECQYPLNRWLTEPQGQSEQIYIPVIVTWRYLKLIRDFVARDSVVGITTGYR